MLLTSNALGSEPVAAVRYPPACKADRNGGKQRPPERQNDVGNYAKHCKYDPENLLFHLTILSSGFLFAAQTYKTSAMKRRVAEIAEATGGRVIGDAALEVN